MDVTDTRWVIAELDAHGELDAHAAMCLQFAIERACAAPSAAVLVDLRDLNAIGTAALDLFRRHDSDCRAAGAQLAVLLRPDTRQEAVVRGFRQAGLGDRILFDAAPDPPQPRPTRRRRATVRWSRRAATAPR